ncbi:MAG TPA: hypothetical protein VJ579_01360 [Candidatus Paceibacterota bacterium]|nr:hypothetical protein [Candidatus Paceibacterota bacterium]
MSQPQSLSSEKPGGEATLGYAEQSFPPGVTMVQGDPAARAMRKEREIVIIPNHQLSDLNLVSYLLAKQKRGCLAQTHIVSEKGRLILGVRAYPKNPKSPATVAFIVLEATGEFAGLFKHKDKALQMQVYGMWNTPVEHSEVIEKMRKVIPGVIPSRRFFVTGRRTVILDGERLDASLVYTQQRRKSMHTPKPFAA